MAIMHVYWQSSNQQMPCDWVQAHYTKSEAACPLNGCWVDLEKHRYSPAIHPNRACCCLQASDPLCCALAPICQGYTAALMAAWCWTMSLSTLCFVVAGSPPRDFHCGKSGGRDGSFH